MESIIDIRDYSYTYVGAEHATLKNINLSIKQGEFILLVGASGSGKTTLLHSLNGIIPKIKGGDASGEIIVSGLKVKDHRVQEVAEKIGMVFQDPESQFCNLFIRDEVAFGPENLCIEKEEILRRIDEALDYVGLGDASWKYINEISGGQQQRLAISSVLAVDPEILALDDPTANLDPVGTEEIVSVLKKMRDENKTIILATPWLDEFIHLATRIIILDKGKIFADGSPRDVLNRFGGSMKEDLGLWIPQIPEIEIQLRKKGLISNDFLPLTVDEAFEKYHTLTYCSGDTCSCNYPSFAETEDAVIVDNVTFTYPDGTIALKDVSFSAKKGGLTAILGPNGSGKSTIAKLMVGLLPLRQGNISICGMNVKEKSIAEITKNVGFVFQNPEHQFVRDTVFQEIAYSLEVMGRDQHQLKADVENIMAEFELEEFRDRHPYTLSGGQKRRLSVATMLINKPQILILDEPTYGQDSKNVNTLMKLIKEHLKKGITVIVITHNMRIVQEYADEVIVLSHGAVRYKGLPEDIWSSGEFARDITLKQPPLQQLVERLQKNGQEIKATIRTVEQFVSQVEEGIGCLNISNFNI